MRLYNGCPDSELKAIWDENDRIRAAIKARGFTVTYFPNGEFYQAFDTRCLSVGRECDSLAEVLRGLP